MFQDLPLFDTEPASALSASGGSRFSRWFQGDSGVGAGLFGNSGSRGGSRRSSINEGEFGYLNGRLFHCDILILSSLFLYLSIIILTKC